MAVFVEKNAMDTFARKFACYQQKAVEMLVVESLLIRELMAEFIGTAFLLALGCGCSMTNTLSNGANGNIVTQDIGWGLTVAFAVIATGGVTGGHLNPAVSLAFAFLNQLSWRKLPLYVLVQFVGAVVGSATAYGIYYDAFAGYDGGAKLTLGATNGTAFLFATYPQAFVTNWSGFVNEVFATGILMFCVMSLNDKRNVNIPTSFVPLFVGLVILMMNCSLCYNSGCAMNPARDMGPRFFTLIAGWGVEVFSYRNYTWFLVPLFGPLVGAPLGALVYNLFIGFHWPKEKCSTTSTSSTDCSSALRLKAKLASMDGDEDLDIDVNYSRSASVISNNEMTGSTRQLFNNFPTNSCDAKK